MFNGPKRTSKKALLGICPENGKVSPGLLLDFLVWYVFKFFQQLSPAGLMVSSVSFLIFVRSVSAYFPLRARISRVFMNVIIGFF